MRLSRTSVSAIACPGTLRCAPCLSGASGRVDSEATAMLRPVLGEVINGTANGSSTPTSSSSACGSPGSSCALNGTIKAPLSIFGIRSRLLRGAASPPAASSNCRRLKPTLSFLPARFPPCQIQWLIIGPASRARGGRCLRSKETTVSQTPSASPTPSAIRWRGSRGAESAPSVRLSSPSLTLSASVCPQVSCKHAACQRNNLYMSEEFRRRRCGPLFDEWKRCFDAEVCESCVLARIA